MHGGKERRKKRKRWRKWQRNPTRNDDYAAKREDDMMWNVGPMRKVLWHFLTTRIVSLFGPEVAFP